jgi:hypothetical protein
MGLTPKTKESMVEADLDLRTKGLLVIIMTMREDLLGKRGHI